MICHIKSDETILYATDQSHAAESSLISNLQTAHIAVSKSWLRLAPSPILCLQNQSCLDRHQVCCFSIYYFNSFCGWLDNIVPSTAVGWDVERTKRWEPVAARKRVIEEIMKWPCRAARIFGFWPFFINDNNKLHFRWLSIGTLLSLSNFIVVLVSFVVFFQDHDQVFVPVDSDEVRLSSTETAGFIILGVSQGLTTLSLLITILATRNKIVSVWNSLSVTADMICRRTEGHAGSELRQWIRKATNEHKALILFLLMVSTVRNLMELWPTLENIFELGNTWKICLYTMALVTWSVISDMQTTFLLVFVGFVDVMTICFRVLSYQADNNTQLVPSQELGTITVETSSPSLRSLLLAQELTKLTEELNEKLKFPMVGIVVSTIVTVTVSIFFTATVFSRWKFEVGNLSLFLSITIYLLHLHVLCSTGSTFSLEVNVGKFTNFYR